MPLTHRRVEVPHVAVIGFEHGKIAFERIYWDQATLLVQVGLIDPSTLPVVGAEQVRVLLDPTRPRNELITRATTNTK